MKRTLHPKNTHAVSPVVGVMLMLVVTIIIAAVVSAFAGGLSGGSKAAPQASLVAKSFVVNHAHNYNGTASSEASDIYVIFENRGGDGINLNNIEIRLSALKYPHQSSTISNAIAPNSTSSRLIGDKSLIPGFSKNWATYIEGYPDHATTVAPGSQFVLHADTVRAVGYDGSYYYDNTIYWLSPTATSTSASLPVTSGDYLLYDIIDKTSGKEISSGQIMVPYFTADFS